MLVYRIFIQFSISYWGQIEDHFQNPVLIAKSNIKSKQNFEVILNDIHQVSDAIIECTVQMFVSI